MIYGLAFCLGIKELIWCKIVTIHHVTVSQGTSCCGISPRDYIKLVRLLFIEIYVGLRDLLGWGLLHEYLTLQFHFGLLQIYHFNLCLLFWQLVVFKITEQESGIKLKIKFGLLAVGVNIAKLIKLGGVVCAQIAVI